MALGPESIPNIFIPTAIAGGVGLGLGRVWVRGLIDTKKDMLNTYRIDPSDERIKILDAEIRKKVLGSGALLTLAVGMISVASEYLK